MLATMDSSFSVFRPHQHTVAYDNHCTLTKSYVLFGNLSLFASYAKLMRPKKVETAVHGLLAFRLTNFYGSFKG